jgi:hypothetical protein
MLILVDAKMPKTAKQKLAIYGEVVEFATEEITYTAISGHPDIFFCPTPAGLIVAPNLPEKYLSILHHHTIRFTLGGMPVGFKYPESAYYNALINKGIAVLNTRIADKTILELNPGIKEIHIEQGYTRCNLLALPNHTFITSDRAIEKTLKSHEYETLFVDPTCVKLDGFEHGFAGGAFGLYNNTLFLCGSLSWFNEEQIIQDFVSRAGVRIVELYDGQPIDVGTILFLG